MTMAQGWILSALSWLPLILSAIGCAYLSIATIRMRAHLRIGDSSRLPPQAVTVLKPLHGPEPRLFDNLATFLTQDYGAPVQMLCGVGRRDDPAIGVVEALRAAYPTARIDLVIDPTIHGANGKIGNLINMSRAIAYDIVILSDSDMSVAPDYLSRVTAALSQPDVGVVSCAYQGRGDAGFWSRFAAAQTNYQFLPNMLFGVASGMASPCMGSTIALTRQTLDRIGGFAAFADILADDHAIGAAVRATGQRISVPPLVITHAFTEKSAGALISHELRWGATVRDLALGGYLGSVVTYPLPLAVIGCIVHPVAGTAMFLLALLLRSTMKLAIDALIGHPPIPTWLLPARDMASFAIFAGSLIVRRVDWRGERLTMKDKGRIEAKVETTL